MAVINTPPYSDKIEPPLFTWFTQVYTICFSLQQSGITANRPIKSLWVGRRYYDTTLNKPVYLSAINPTVWRDAAAAIV